MGIRSSVLFGKSLYEKGRMHCGCEKSQGEWSTEKEGQLLLAYMLAESAGGGTDGTDGHEWNIFSTRWKASSGKAGIMSAFLYGLGPTLNQKDKYKNLVWVHVA